MQEDQEAILGYIVRPILKQKVNNNQECKGSLEYMRPSLKKIKQSK